VKALAIGCLSFVTLFWSTDSTSQERKNYYDDPFAQITSAIAGCPVPEGPLITREEAQAQAHGRVDRGTTCFRSGRCRLPNAYLYDKDIIPRVVKNISGDGRFDNTSIWVIGQRRWVYVMGCVSSADQISALLAAVRGIDDVEAVIDELSVGAKLKPRYRALPDASK
jgi:BON domain